MSRIQPLPSMHVLGLINRQNWEIPEEILVDAHIQERQLEYQLYLQKRYGVAPLVRDYFDSSSGEWMPTYGLLPRWNISADDLKRVIVDRGIPVWLVNNQTQIAFRTPGEKLAAVPNLPSFLAAPTSDPFLFCRFDDITFLEKALALRNTGTGYWLTSAELQGRWDITETDIRVLLRGKVPPGFVFVPNEEPSVWSQWSSSTLPTLFRTRHVHSLELVHLAPRRFKAHQMEKQHCIDHAYRLHDEQPNLMRHKAAEELKKIPPVSGYDLAKIEEWIALLNLFLVRPAHRPLGSKDKEDRAYRRQSSRA